MHGNDQDLKCWESRIWNMKSRIKKINDRITLAYYHELISTLPPISKDLLAFGDPFMN